MSKQAQQAVFKQLGLNIRQIRLSQNRSLSDVASACNMEKTNLSRIELGKTNPTVGILSKIAAVLDVPLQSFFKQV